MLSRIASELYWKARYLERAETIARVLDVTNKLSMMPLRDNEEQGLQVPLNLTGTGQLFSATYPSLTMHNLVSFFALDSRNHSSIYSCLQMAWNNAHAVRGHLSSEVWESINATWIEMKQIRRQGINSMGADTFFDWVKERSHLFRGAMFGTQLRSDTMCFIRLGTLLERADSTARLLEVKNALMVSDDDQVREYYRMDTLLRAVSASEAYHSIYKQPLSRDTIAELMILRTEIPRSLRVCVGDIVQQLELIGGSSSNHPRRLAHTLLTELRFSTISDLNRVGLHNWLVSFLGRISSIAESVNHTYLEAQ